VFVSATYMGNGEYGERFQAERDDIYCQSDKRCSLTKTVEKDRDVYIVGPWLGFNYPLLNKRVVLSTAVGWQHVHISHVGSDNGAGFRIGVQTPITKQLSAGVDYFRILNDIEDVDVAAVNLRWRF